jgi:hypothetical protein
LIDHLGTWEAARYLSIWRQGSSNYLKIRKKLFEGETVDTLYNKIVDFEKAVRPFLHPQHNV